MNKELEKLQEENIKLKKILKEIEQIAKECVNDNLWMQASCLTDCKDSTQLRYAEILALKIKEKIRGVYL